MNIPDLPALSRRRFLTQAALTGSLAFPAVRRAMAAAASANGDIRVAVIGLGNKGKSHVRNLLQLSGVRVAALCDVDAERLAAQVKAVKEAGDAPFIAQDPRRILERSDVDAVIIATPNHWHAVLAVWACRAGKDVYVEKPISHSIWEGRQIDLAARRHGRIVQSGTQYRSDDGLRAAADWIREGHIGRPQSAHVLWYEYRPGIGRAAPHRPDNIDYDVYCGPAPLEPLTRPRLHYDWHWFWSTGDGDLANSGIHAFDACRMLAGISGLPSRTMSLGGRFAVDDAAETPNTQLTLLDYPTCPMIIENRNLPMKSGVKAMDQHRGIREGFVLECEGGAFVGFRGGGWIHDRDGTRIRQFPGDGGKDHMPNFLEAVRTRNAQILRAPVVEGHVSSSVCHLGNLSWRLGAAAAANACRDAVGKHAHAAETLARLERNLEANGVDWKQQPFVLGPWIQVAPGTDEIAGVEGGDAALLAKARRLAHGTQRDGFGFDAAG